jgi:hypothetical protein
MYLKIVLLLVFSRMLLETHADILSEQIYIDIKSTVPCIRRLNSTHEIGCGDADKSNYNGVVYHVENMDDLLRLNQIKPSRPLILVTRPQQFQNCVDFHLNSDKNNLVNGIVLLKSTTEDDKPDGYSDDKPVPNANFGYDVDQSPNWNPTGSSNQFIHFKIPIYLVYNKVEIETIIEFYNKFNSNYFLNLANGTSSSNNTGDLLLGLLKVEIMTKSFPT